MGLGIDAVKRELMSGLGAIEIRQAYDTNTDSTALGFDWQGNRYAVRVSRRFFVDAVLQ